jgi:prepilin-type N-terminal cleavage/methylation domain-containing protein
MAETTNRGFTLLELLVVVAIISLLAVISLAFLGDSKDKGGDAGVKQALVNARSQAEVYYANNAGSYEGVCSTGAARGIDKQVRAAARAYGITPQEDYFDTAGDYDTEACHDSEDEYAVWVPLNDSTFAVPRGFCIDSHNITRESSSPLGAGEFRCY